MFHRIIFLSSYLIAIVGNASAFVPPTTSLRVTAKHHFSRPPKPFTRHESSSSNTRGKTTALNANLSTAVATAAATRGINSHYLVRILFLRALAFVYTVAFLVAFRQNKALIGDNGITPARDVLNQVEERASEKRKQREERWGEQNNQGKTREPLPPSSHSDDSGVIGAVLKTTKMSRIIGDKLNSSNTFQNIREILWDRSDRMGRLYPTLLWFIPKEDRENNMNEWLDRIALAGIGLSLSMFVLGAANVPMLLSLWVCQRSIMSVGGPWYGFGWEPQVS